MPYKPLPDNPSLTHLRNQAHDLRKAVQAQEPQALQRVREFHPRPNVSEFALGDAQTTIAREYCYPSWAKLKEAVEHGDVDRDKPKHERIQDPIFRQAVEFSDTGDVSNLRRLLGEHPEIVRQRVYFDIGDYFGRPTLLEFIAENPIRRGSMPPNVLEVARIILEAGASQDKAAIDRTLGLVSSGRIARESGAQGPLIDLLCDFGAEPNSAMRPALVHGEFAAVEALIRRGAALDLPAAAALGLTEESRRLLPLADGDQRHWALALAAQFGRTPVVLSLIEAGVDPNRFNPVGGHSHSMPLHQAAIGGHLETVKALIEHGARTDVADILFGGTPLGWARHGGQSAVAEYLESLV